MTLACDGCLGSGRCWVCLGQGVLDERRLTPCHRCYASGKCHMCQPLRLIDLGTAESTRAETSEPAPSPHPADTL
jgi:hypothetical protein